jgi:epoxide hydrolase 4
MIAPMAGWSERVVTLRTGVDLHLVEAGEGRPVILLHGFPEFWYSWRAQIPALAAAGFHVVAPDLRGYNLSSRPSGIENYSIDALSDDVIALIEQFGGSVALVGHDWGGVIAWQVSRRSPRLLRKLVIINIPHPRAIRRALRSPGQWARFSYQLFFQPPFLPELLLRARNYWLLRTALRRLIRNERALSTTDMERYVAAWSHPGALRAMLDYYRALFRRSRLPRLKRTASDGGVPTLLIWGAGEPVFPGRSFRWSEEMDPETQLVRLENAGHFAQHDQPERVNELLIGFLR